jgi:hypothetical protein
MDEVIKIWHAATADQGPDGDKARQLIKRVTGVRIALICLCIDFCRVGAD